MSDIPSLITRNQNKKEVIEFHGKIELFVDGDDNVTIPPGVRRRIILISEKCGETCYLIEFESKSQADPLLKELSKMLESEEVV